jgi:2'-5' RNA ligase
MIMARLFLALWPDDRTREQLFDVAKQFNNENIRLVKKSNLHMTLEFLGEVSDEDSDELIKRLNDVKAEPFEIELTRIGFWKKPQILYVGTTIVPKQLLTLVKAIKKCVKQQRLKTDDREYKPHVTIVRKVKQKIIPKEMSYINWQVNSFTLVVSNSTNQGVEYKVIKEWQVN